MNDDIWLSRRRVSRRRALALGGTVSLGGLLAACGGDDNGSGADTVAKTATTETNTTATTATGGSDVAGLLDKAPSCTMTAEQTQGPYWFDVDSIRDDVREERPGARLDLALRVQDLSKCEEGGAAAPVTNSVVEIWHCDAGGSYSGFGRRAAAEAHPAVPAAAEAVARRPTGPTQRATRRPRRATTAPTCAALSLRARTGSRASPRSIRAGTRGARSTST